MTVIELLLAAAGIALIGLAIAAMLSATSYGTSSRTDLRSLVVKHKAVGGRLSAAVRSSRMVLAQGDGYLVLWLADLNDNDQPDLSELRRIERDGAGQVTSYLAPDDLDPNDDVTFDLSSDDFDAVTNAIKGGATFPASLWATGVPGWDVTLNDADPHVATLVTWRLTLSAGDLTDIGVSTAALRNVEQP